jgi:hypothetical protein
MRRGVWRTRPTVGRSSHDAYLGAIHCGAHV